MSLCRLMVLDFMKGWGRIDEDTGMEMYDRRDIQVGLSYAEGYIEDGLIFEPFYKFRLSDFAAWCRKKLEDPTIT